MKSREACVALSRTTARQQRGRAVAAARGRLFEETQTLIASNCFAEVPFVLLARRITCRRCRWYDACGGAIARVEEAGTGCVAGA